MFSSVTCPSLFCPQANLTNLPRTEYVPGVGNGIAKCPFDPDDNSTAVWVEHGNPGDLAGLYSGTVAEFTKADNVIFRTDLYNTTTKRQQYLFKRTIKYDSKWLDSERRGGKERAGVLSRSAIWLDDGRGGAGRSEVLFVNVSLWNFAAGYFSF